MNRTGINPSGAMPANAFEDENKAKIKADLLKTNPMLRYRGIDQVVDAIWKGSAWGDQNAEFRPSDAVRSDGQLHNSDAEPGDEFFTNPEAMESYRKREMGSGFPETSDPEDERYFGGPEQLRKMQTHAPETEGGGQTREGTEPGLEFGQTRPAGAQSLETKAGAGHVGTPIIFALLY